MRCWFYHSHENIIIFANIPFTLFVFESFESKTYYQPQLPIEKRSFSKDDKKHIYALLWIKKRCLVLVSYRMRTKQSQLLISLNIQFEPSKNSVLVTKKKKWKKGTRKILPETLIRLDWALYQSHYNSQ